MGNPRLDLVDGTLGGWRMRARDTRLAGSAILPARAMGARWGRWQRRWEAEESIPGARSRRRWTIRGIRKRELFTSKAGRWALYLSLSAFSAPPPTASKRPNDSFQHRPTREAALTSIVFPQSLTLSIDSADRLCPASSRPHPTSLPNLFLPLPTRQLAPRTPAVTYDLKPLPSTPPRLDDAYVSVSFMFLHAKENERNEKG